MTELFDQLFPEKGAGKHDLEDLITLVNELMPHPQAEMVIASCLVTAGLMAASEDLKNVNVDVHDRTEGQWDDVYIEFSLNGVELAMEVKLLLTNETSRE